MASERCPVLTDPGWFLSQPVGYRAGTVGQGDARFEHADKALLFYADGTVRFEHKCDRGDRGLVVCAPALQLDGGHTITTRDPVVDRGTPITVTPSILCPDCGTHGFVRNGRWVAA